MAVQIRAKFRLLSKTEHEGGYVELHLRPVTARAKHAPDGSEENARYWSATPGGEIQLHLPPGEPAPCPVGACCYVDLEAGAELVEGEHPWQLGDCVLGGWTLGLVLHPVGRSGKVEMRIDNPDAVIPLLAEMGADYLALWECRQAGTSSGDARDGRGRWRVRLTPAG